MKQQQRMESKLEFPQSVILTPYNYFEWKPNILLHLRSRGLFRVTMETEVEPTLAVEKTRYFNRMDKDFDILCLSISPKFLFHVEPFSTPNEVWKNLEGFFGKRDEMQGHILENELNSLNPRNFENIQDFFTRYKALLLQLKGCGIDKSKQIKSVDSFHFIKTWSILCSSHLYIPHSKICNWCNLKYALIGFFYSAFDA